MPMPSPKRVWPARSPAGRTPSATAIVTRSITVALGGAAVFALATSAGAQDRPLPYWASIAAGKALMRTGPDRGYPALWLYTRRDLPVRVLQIEGAWRRVQEQDGTAGWMQAILLAARRTAMVTGGYRPIREGRDAGSRLLWQAEAGVIGRISQCDGRWCRIEIGARRGYVEQTGLYGVADGEVVE